MNDAKKQADDLYNLFLRMEDSSPDTREEIVKAPFGWPGAKTRCYNEILPHLPYRESWNDVCGGTGIMTLARKPSGNDTFNDRNSGVTSFYRIIKDQDKFNEFCKWITDSCHSREEFTWCRDTWKNCEDDLERACRWFYMIKMSFSQLGRNFARATNGKACHPQMLRNSLDVLGKTRIRFREVQVENLDIFDFMKDFCDKQGAVNLYDPNYIGVYKCYDYEIDMAGHARLCDMIMTSKGYHVLCGYANDVYDNPEFKWDKRLTYKHRSTIEGHGTSENSAKKTSNEKWIETEEVLWIKDND